MTEDRDILSIDYDDDNENYEALSKHLQEDTERKKRKIANEFDAIGDDLLTEIERKRNNKKNRSRELIPYILKYSDDKYSEDELFSYSFDDIQEIYTEIRSKRKPLIAKIFNFLFNT